MNSENFVNFIFNQDTKISILNLLQFTFIAIIPIILLIKVTDIIPEASEKKGFLELLFEFILQICIIVVGVVIIARFTVYFKPFTGVPYPEFSLFPLIISFLIVQISFDTNLNSKIKILYDKITHKIKGEKPKASMNNDYTFTKPMVQSSTPVTMPTQQQPNYNLMYATQPNTVAPIVNAVETMMPNFNPIAANEIGSSFGGSNF